MRVILLLFLILSANVLFAQQIDSLKKPTVDTTVFTKVDVEASVDAQQWIDHLSSILRPYIEKAANKGMKPGTYTVQVKFLVERDGSINYVEALNDPGYNLAKGAVRAVKTGPRWTSGQENGKSVRSYHTQPITFVIQIE
jgi:periplasmic protein TonB